MTCAHDLDLDLVAVPMEGGANGPTANNVGGGGGGAAALAAEVPKLIPSVSGMRVVRRR